MATCDAKFPISLLATRSPEGEPVAISYPMDRVTVAICMKELGSEGELSTLLAALKIAERGDGAPKTLVRLFLCGKRNYEQKPNETRVETYWIPAETWQRLRLASDKVLIYVLRGEQTVSCLQTFPRDVRSLIPRLSLKQIAEKIAAGDNSEMISAYSQVRERHETFGLEAVTETLEVLAGIWGGDVRQAQSCFSRQRFSPSDQSDIFDPRDLTYKQFSRRLLNFCSQSAQKSSPVVSPDTDFLSQSRIKVLEGTVETLKNELREKDRVITALRTELQTEKNRQGMSRKLSGDIPSSEMEMMLEDDSEQESPRISLSSKYRSDIPDAKSLFGRPQGACSTLPVPSHKALSLSPALSPVPATMLCPMLNSRPAGFRRKSPAKGSPKGGPKSALRITANLKRIEQNERGVLQQAGKLSFSRA